MPLQGPAGSGWLFLFSLYFARACSISWCLLTTQDNGIKPKNINEENNFLILAVWVPLPACASLLPTPSCSPPAQAGAVSPGSLSSQRLPEYPWASLLTFCALPCSNLPVAHSEGGFCHDWAALSPESWLIGSARARDGHHCPWSTLLTQEELAPCNTYPVQNPPWEPSAEGMLQEWQNRHLHPLQLPSPSSILSCKQHEGARSGVQHGEGHCCALTEGGRRGPAPGRVAVGSDQGSPRHQSPYTTCTASCRALSHRCSSHKTSLLPRNPPAFLLHFMLFWIGTMEIKTF